MFFDRDNNLRRQKQVSYRNQLKNEIQLNNSKILANRSQRLQNQKQETFSLLKNIQIQAQTRKNKQSQYYIELRSQIQKQKQQKRRKKEQQAYRQRQEQEKIRKDNEVLKERAQRQLQKENSKKRSPVQQNNLTGPVLSNSNRNNNNKRIKLQNSSIKYQSNNNLNFPLNGDKNFQSRLKTSQSNNDEDSPDGKLPIETNNYPFQRKRLPSITSIPTYANRVQNQPFNFLPQRKYMDSYFHQLLGQRKRFQQQASSISELNKIFYQEKSRAGKIQSRGLEQLKKLQMLLQEKSSDYVQNYSKSRINNDYESSNSFTKKLTIPNLYESRQNYNSGWRKLD